MSADARAGRSGRWSFMGRARWAARELRRESGLLAPSALALAVGLYGTLVAVSLKGSASSYLAAKSRDILAADATVAALRPLRPAEIAAARAELGDGPIAEEISFNAVLRGAGDRTALAEVRAVSETYPVYGAFELEDADGRRRPKANAAPLSEAPVAWATPDAFAQLGVRVGDRVSIGKLSATVVAVATKAPGTSGLGGFAPRVFIGRAFAQETGLLGFGGQVFHRAYLGLGSSSRATTGRASPAEALKRALPDPEIFVRTPDDATQSFDRLFASFGLYLSSLALALLTLALAAAAFCLSGFAQTRRRNAAVLGILGAGAGTVGSLYALEIAAVALGACAAAWAAADATAEAARAFAWSGWPEGFDFRVTWRERTQVLAVACAAAVAFAAPMARGLRAASPRSLLDDEAGLGEAARLDRSLRSRALDLALALLPLSLAAVALGWELTGSVRASLGVVGGLGAAVAAGWAVGRVSFAAGFRFARSRPGALRVAMASLGRARPGTSLLFTALFASCLVLNVAPHLLATAQAELAPLQEGRFPDYFLFNVPDESLKKLEEFASSRRARLEHVSPMIVARWTKHGDGAPRDPQFARFPARLSYRARPISSERVIAGRWPDGAFDPSSGRPAEISAESGFAERNGIRLGDRLEFDVLGLPVAGVVTSMRRVRWTDFHPNFFLEFQPGVLDDAPKTWLASLTFERAERNEGFRDLLRDFPEVSAIDVGRALERASETAASVAGPVQAGAWATSGAAFLVLAAATAHGLRSRRREYDVQKIVGADGRLIVRIALLEHAVLAGTAAAVGTGAGLLVARFVAVRFFELDFRASGSAAALAAGAAVSGVCGICAWAVNRALTDAGHGR